MSRPEDKSRFLETTRQIDELVLELRPRLETLDPLPARALKYLDQIRTAASALRAYGEEHLEENGFASITPRDDTAYQEIRHEIRNRLNHMSGPSQLLQRCLEGEEWQDAVGLLRLAINECLTVIDTYGSPDGAQIQRLEPGFLPSPSPQISLTEELGTLPARILVAEDEAENREILREMLESEGHEVSLATDGEEALRMAREGEFDVLLLDLTMPKKSGFDVLAELRETGLLKLTPVIVVTGQNAVDAAVRCIAQGATDFITKPVAYELLRARLSACLESKRLREREFMQFFPPALAREFARHPDLRDMEGKAAEVSILFCDIRGFSTISERLGPQETVRWLRAVMNALSDCVIDHGGVLVDYAGDELMAMWGAPRDTPDHARLACETALEMLDLLPSFNAEWEKLIGGPTLFGVGINSGTALVGNIGTDRKFKYGPLGNTVNVASRVQSATKQLHSHLLITRSTFDALPGDWNADRIRRLCKVRVKNIHEPVDLFEVTRQSGPGWESLRRQYEAALDATEHQDLSTAVSKLGQILIDFPGDGPSELLMARLLQARLAKTDALESVWTLPTK